MLNKNTVCPCGRMQGLQTLMFQACCGRYMNHFATCPAPDAESLMRSRYSAFVCERAEYLKATWSPETCPSDIDFDPEVKWLGLAIKRSRQHDADRAEVEFVARSRLNGRATRLHEISQFHRRDGRWFYIDGVYA